MKKIFTFIVVVGIILSAGSLSAQSFKFAHINSQELLQAMPELATAQEKIAAYEKDLQEILQDLQAEFQRKSQEFDDKQSSWSDAVKNAKQRELADIVRRVQDHTQTSEQQLGEEYQKLVGPIVNKAREAINRVAKNNGYTYVFDLATNVLIYWNESQSTDLLPLVKKELNIQ